MTNLGNSLPIKNAFGSGRVQLEPDADVGAHVHAEGLAAQALASSSHDSVKLRFCRALSDDCLGLRPRLDAVLANANAPA